MEFCQTLAVDEYLTIILDKIRFLQVFSHQNCDRRIAPSKKPVKVGTVLNALTAVGQAFEMVGLDDPQKSNTAIYLDLVSTSS